VNFGFYDHAATYIQRNLFAGGSQDSGKIKYDGGNMVWKVIRRGDGATGDIDRH
jgi:hypothetical protein